MSQFNQGQVSCARLDYETPWEFFEYWHKIFHFTLDAAANGFNHKCDLYFNEVDDGLAQKWAPHRVWLNPPYGRGIGAWISKAAAEAMDGALVVCLVKFAPDTGWWQTIDDARATVLPVRGRLKFGTKINAPFASAVVIFWPHAAHKTGQFSNNPTTEATND